jgi:Na+/citrate or Na+/malate symporter
MKSSGAIATARALGTSRVRPVIGFVIGTNPENCEMLTICAIAGGGVAYKTIPLR